MNQFFHVTYRARAEEAYRRYLNLVAEFAFRFGVPATQIARAPGRVNLIGEHIDYNGFAVLPMTIDRDIAAAFRPRADDLVVVDSLDTAEGARRFPLWSPIPPYAAGDWGNYAKAAAQALLRTGGFRPIGADILLSSDLPPSAGLSSSSALVVLVALILLFFQGKAVNRLALADLLAEAETFVGTRGGGMDQAACLMGEGERAVRVSFNPLAVRPVDVPGDWRFVIADSGVRASKAQAPQYNLRAAECRMAAALLAERPVALLADIPDAERTAEFLDEVLADRGYDIEEVAARVGLEPAEVLERFLIGPDGGSLPQPGSGFPLRRRVDHVFSEARRVEEACEAMAGGDLSRMGSLMNDSHASCRAAFEISCPELDSLTRQALDLGAAGSRLTGAGFGGCTVSLVREEQADRVASALAVSLAVAHAPAAAFVCAPGGRAQVIGTPRELALG